MKLSTLTVVVCILGASSANAQEQKSDAATRLSASLGGCIGFLESRNDQVYELQKKLDFAIAEIKTLKEKSNAEQKPSPSPDNGGSGTQP